MSIQPSIEIQPVSFVCTGRIDCLRVLHRTSLLGQETHEQEDGVKQELAAVEACCLPSLRFVLSRM